MKETKEGVKLVGMCEFVKLMWDKTVKDSACAMYRYLTLKYCEFLESTLKLGDFIECDLDGKPLDKPKDFNHYENTEGEISSGYDRTSVESKAFTKAFEILEKRL